MSASAELQKLIFERLVADAGVGALVADRIYDLAPATAPFPHISFGPSDTLDDDADCIIGRVENIQLDVWSRAKDGFLECKRITDAVKTALHHYSADMGVNALVDIRVPITRMMRDPDGITSHGIVTVEALVEEN